MERYILKVPALRPLYGVYQRTPAAVRASFVALASILVLCMLWMNANTSSSLRRGPLQLREASRLLQGVDTYCAAVVTPNDDVMVKIRHVGSPSFWVSVPPQPSFLSAWATNALPGPLTTAGSYEQFQRYMMDAPAGSVMLDIGAHVGVPAMAVAAAGHAVISFEPVPLNQRLYKQAVCFNAFQDRVTLVHAAVGEQDGSISIFVPRGFSDNTALSKSAAIANVGLDADEVMVDMVTLDNWWRQHGNADLLSRVALVKVDVQGNEVRVFKGARDVLAKLPRSTWIVAEHDPKLMAKSGVEGTADIEAMVAAGYTPYNDFKGAVIAPESFKLLGTMDIWYRKT